MEADDKLNFDAKGNPIGTDNPGSFAYSALKIQRIHQSATELKITADRVALVFETALQPPPLKSLTFVPLYEWVDITLALDTSHPERLDSAIHKIFAFSLQDAFSGKTGEDINTALDTIGSAAPSDATATAMTFVPHTNLRFYSAGSSETTPPQIIRSQYPSDPYRNGGGHCVLSMIVDKNGGPNHIRVQHSLNPDLDIDAVIAMSQYIFQPAMDRGAPVPCT